MIYFKIIFNVIKTNFLKFLTFFILSLCVLVGVEKKESILKNYMKFNSEKAQMSFVTDELGKSVEIKNKLMVLPGVQSVKVEKSKELQDKVKNLFKDENFQEILEESNIRYVKYILTFEPMITEKSIKLIKSFIIKILPEKDVVFSSARGVKKKGESAKTQNSKVMIFYTVFGLMGLLIAFLHHGLMLELKRFSYLYQRFQRKKYIPLKAGLLFSFLFILLSASVTYTAFSSLVIFPLSLMSLFLVATTCLLNLKNYEWK